MRTVVSTPQKRMRRDGKSWRRGRHPHNLHRFPFALAFTAAARCESRLSVSRPRAAAAVVVVATATAAPSDETPSPAAAAAAAGSSASAFGPGTSSGSGGGTLGLLIPPSLSFLIYGALTETSIGRLFAAGIIPGIMVGAMFMLYLLVKCIRNPAIAPRDPYKSSVREIIVGFRHIWPLLLLIFAVIGSIVAGIATPTESAGVGVVLAIVICSVWGDLTFSKLIEAVYQSVLLFSSIGFLVLGATILAQSVSILGLPQQILETVAQSGFGTYSVLMIVVLIYLVLGCFFDGLSLMIMTLPVVFPLLTGLGFDPIWIGVIITIVIEIGQITPPVGLNLSVLTALTNNEVSLGRVAYATVPYWLIHLCAIVMLTLFPMLALFLPNLLF